jgi:hypothetical protein
MIEIFFNKLFATAALANNSDIEALEIDDEATTEINYDDIR